MFIYRHRISDFFFRIKTDLQDQADKPLVNMELSILLIWFSFKNHIQWLFDYNFQMTLIIYDFLDECSQGLINLSIAGIATPYVHNSTTMIGVCKMN